MDTGKRVIAIRKFLELTQTQLASIIGTTQNVVSLIENGKIEISSEQIECLVNKIHVNRDWIENEDGKMFNANSIPESLLTKEQLEKIITNSNFTSNSVPYYDKPVEGIYENISMPEQKYMIDYPPFNDCSFYRPMFGESMSPKFKSGDIIACKKINDISHIMYGEVYLCIYREGDTMFETLRTLRKSDDTEYISLVPLNPNFDSIKIPKASIISLYIIKGKIERFL